MFMKKEKKSREKKIVSFVKDFSYSFSSKAGWIRSIKVCSYLINCPAGLLAYLCIKSRWITSCCSLDGKARKHWAATLVTP